MRYSALFAAILSVLAIGMARPSLAQLQDPTPGQQVEQEQGGDGIHYLLFLPDGYNQTKSWPVIVYLHSAGATGSDITSVTKEGIPKLLQTGGLGSFDILRKNFIVISPQCPTGSFWLSQMNKVMSIVDSVVRLYRGDPSHVCLVGASMGGCGVWNYAAAAPWHWSAAVVVSGGLAPHYGGPNLASLGRIGASLPIWVLHGENDDVIPYSDALNATHLLQNSGGPTFVPVTYPSDPAINQPRVFTTFPGMRHDIFDIVFSDPTLYNWLLHWKGSGYMQ